MVAMVVLIQIYIRNNAIVEKEIISPKKSDNGRRIAMAKMLGSKRPVQTCRWGCCDQHKIDKSRHTKRMKMVEKREWKRELEEV